MNKNSIIINKKCIIINKNSIIINKKCIIINKNSVIKIILSAQRDSKRTCHHHQAKLII